jgi:hypothetical protein
VPSRLGGVAERLHVGLSAPTPVALFSRSLCPVRDLVEMNAAGSSRRGSLQTKEAWLAAAREQGKPVPKPRFPRSHPSLHSA